MSIVEEIRKEVLEKSKNHKEKDGLDIYYDHIWFVVKNAKYLAKKYHADLEIVELGALLHDIAIITENGPREKHHLYGKDLAEQLLQKYHYPKEKIERVKKCVLNHRGMKDFPRNSIEEEIVADADVIAHFDALPSLFSDAFHVRGLNLEEGTEFVFRKLQRDYQKLSPRSKELFKNRYDQIMKILFTNRVKKEGIE